MAAFSDILLRADAILEKYEHYDTDAENKRTPRKKSEDPFSDKYFEIMDRVQELNLKAENLNGEKNRALKAALNAELRKEKALLQEEVLALQALVRDKKTPPEVEMERLERLAEVQEAVDEVPDGTAGSSLKPQRALNGNGSASYSQGRIDIDGSGLNSTLANPEAYQHTEQTSEFVRDASMAKGRQDLALDNIERGLSTLKELGTAMGEELERHDVMIDEVGNKMDTVTKELQTNNMKLKGLVTQVRSTRKFFIDIILVCVLLAVGLYLYNMLK